MPQFVIQDMEEPSSQSAQGGRVKHISGSVFVTDTPRAATPDVVSTRPNYSAEQLPDLVTEEENSQMQICWNRAMCEEMKIPEGYENVAVLIIKWANEIDQLNSANEVEHVRKVFQNDFNYPTTVIKLNNATSPQLQLDLRVMEFVSKYNGRHNLLIIYYSGHGSFDEKKSELSLHASDDFPSMPDGTIPAQAIWNNAERALIEHADCDMLTIFDACYASNIHKAVQKEDPRTYEMLTATGHDSMTAGPGPRSFTTALLSSLKALLREKGDASFTTRQLCEKINLHPERRKHQSHNWSRFKRYDRHIALAPLKKTLEARKQEYSQDDTRSLLTLSLPLTVARLSHAQIEALARSLSKAVKSVKAPVKRVDWWKLRSSGRTTDFAGVTIFHGVARKWLRDHQSRKSPSPAPVPVPVSMRDQPCQTTHVEHGTADDGSQTVEPYTRQLKRQGTTEMDDAPVSPTKRSRTEDLLMQMHLKPRDHPLTPPEAIDVDVST